MGKEENRGVRIRASGHLNPIKEIVKLAQVL
jgi:hypothetical protein